MKSLQYRCVKLLVLALVVGLSGAAAPAAAGPRGSKATAKKKRRPVPLTRPAAQRGESTDHRLRQASTLGYFHDAPAARVREVESRYRADRARAGGLASVPPGAIGRVERRHLVRDFARMSTRQRVALRARGLAGLRVGGPVPAELRGTGYEGFATLHYFTSGAGLWSRGGGQVKALIPLNLKELISAAEFRELERAGDVVAAKTPKDALRIAGAPVGQDAKQVIGAARATIERLTAKARASERAINVLDLKLVSVALLSKESGRYVPFDIWTSAQTHAAIRGYLADFRARFARRVFHPEPTRNAEIHAALTQYFAASAKLGETHLFGYQIGLPALDAATGNAVAGSVTIGEGAGMAKAYLDESGRTRVLEGRGVRHWVFQNIEVISDIGLELGAYLASEVPVSVVVVPTKKGYSGGSPYRVEHEGRASYRLLEGSAVPAPLADGNAFFNTNTIYQRIDLEPVANTGYELKDNGQIVRLKMNAGDVTLSNETALVGGRIGREYENFKTYAEFGTNGVALVEAVRRGWDHPGS